MNSWQTNPPAPINTVLTSRGKAAATWEQRSDQIANVFSYIEESGPQYSVCFHRFIPPPWLPGRVRDRALIEVTFDAVIGDISANVNYVGFVGAQLFYYSQGAYAGQSIAAQTKSTPYAFITDNLGPICVAGEAYSPVSLPIGGVDYPVWTQLQVDPLTVRTYLNDSDNPGFLWAQTYLQLIDSIEEAGAATCVTHMSWNTID